MDIDAYVAAHRAGWQRLEQLVSRNRLSGAEVDELVELHARTSTHLSVVRSTSPDPALVSWLTGLVARSRAAVTGSHSPAYRDVAQFLLVRFPAAVYRAWPWWCGVAVATSLVVYAAAAWVAGSAEVQAALLPPEEARALVEYEFANYYTANPAQSFAFQVWSNNAWVAALCIALGILLVPVVLILLTNALNIGVSAGYMAAHGKLDIFFGLITPHGLLELTAVFVAAGAGLRVGWAWIDPGPRTRTAALAEEGRASFGIALGLVLVLLISGIIEGFVTPSGLPTWARIAIGVVAEVAFLAYVFVLGRRAARAGETGDLGVGERADAAPVAG